jgi:hypothetical protein
MGIFSFKKKKSDGMVDDSIEDKAEKIIKYIKNIDAFKSLGVGLTEVLNEFIKQADPELITIINSVEYESYKPDKQQLFFIVFIQQIIINDIIFVEKFFPLKGESYKAQLPDDESGKNLYYIFEFYGLFLKITRTDVSEMIGGASKKRKVKSIIENLFFVFDYDDELYEIEKGSPKVAMGAYFNVLKTLGLQNDFLKLASDDELGRKLQDIKLL